MWNPSTKSYAGSSQDRWSTTNFPQGNDTIIEFANKTIKHIDTAAYTSQRFDNVTDGASFFERFCTGLVLEDESNDNSTETSTPTNNSTIPEPTLTVNPFEPIETDTSVKPRNTWFPEFLASTPDHSVVGYLPKEFPDLAVLQMRIFTPNETNTTVAVVWQNIVRGLLATAKEENRTKLIVDVRGNGGGYVFLGYDSFLQLFPESLPYGGSNSRSTPLYQSMVSIIDGYTAKNKTGNATIDADPLVEAAGAVIARTSFNDRNFLTTDNKPLSSSQAFYGPVTNYGDNFTSVARSNLALTSATAPIDVLGFGDNTQKLPQVFKPENVLLLTDGLCGSTCAVFSEFMKAQAGVKSIAVGGRRQDGPMQAVGGSKGAEVLEFKTIAGAALFASTAANSTANITLTAQLADLTAGFETLNARTKTGTGALRINFKNQLRQGDDSATPLQFVYEAADARFFYTLEMIYHQEKVWQFAYDIHWGNQSAVPGSVGHPSSLSGNLLSYIDAYPPQGADYTFGANATDFPANITNAASTNHPTITPVPAASTGATKFDVSTTYLGTAVKSSATSASSAPTSSGSSAARRNGELGITTGGGALALLALLFM